MVDVVLNYLEKKYYYRTSTNYGKNQYNFSIHIRDLVTIESTFNTEYFEGGCIYFLNTQKLGSDKLLTGTSDTRQYSIWETLTNTAKRSPKQFYVVIDEAHRGT